MATTNPSLQSSPSVSSYMPWLVCLSAGLFFFYEFIQMQMFNSISSDLMRDFSLNAKQLGYLSATYLYADVLFLLPAGIILDRFSTRKVILTAMVLCILGTLIFALVHNVYLAAAAHFLAGIGNGFCFLSCIRLASRWFPPQRMALIIGIMVTMAMAGGMIAQDPLVWLNAWIGWRHALLANAVLGVCIMFIIWCFVRDYPPGYSQTHVQQQKQLQQLGFWQGCKLALKNGQNWLCGIYTSTLNLPIMLLGALWGNLYLTHVMHLTMHQAPKVITIMFLGNIVGGPIVGWLSDHWQRRRSPMIICSIFTLATILSIMYLPDQTYGSLLGLFFALGFFTSGQNIGYPTIAESNPKMLTSTATGLASFLIMGGAALMQPIFGQIMEMNWQGEVINQIHSYPISAYQSAMLIFPITSVLALLMALLIKETYCKNPELR